MDSRSNLQSILAGIKMRGKQSLVARIGLGIVLRIWKLLRLLPGSQWIRVTLPVAGHRMSVRLFSYDDLLTASPGYESTLDEWLPSADAVVVDAGAYIGRHTLAYARAVGPQGRVIAIEPLRDNFQSLARNVALNGYEQVQCVECALGAANGRALLRYSRESSTATSDLRRARIAGQRRVARVAQRTLDDLLLELEIHRIDLLKIDVEGAELSVLSGAQQTLARRTGALVIVELHGADANTEPVLEWLAEHGYHFDRVSDRGRHFAIARKSQPAPSRPRATMAGGV